MTDDLDRRLNGLADLRTPPGPSIATLRERGRQQAARKSRRAAAATVALGAALGVVGFVARDSEPVDVPAAASTENAPAPPAESSAPVSNETTGGAQPITGPGGEVVGSVSAADWDAAMADGPPVRSYGTEGRELQSLDVRDAEGNLVGYFTPGDLGFIPLATANDPVVMDGLLEELPTPLTPEEAKAAFETAFEQASSDDD